MRMFAIALALVFTLSAAAQQAAKHVFLSPKSNITTSQVSEGFSKHCANVVITTDETKADYVLEAANAEKFSNGTSSPRWHFTLFNASGDVVLTTHPGLLNAPAKHFEAVCKFINGAAR